MVQSAQKLSILKIIELNASIDVLLSDEVDFFELKKILDNLKRNNLIVDSFGELHVTKFGKEMIKKMEKELNITNSEKLIVPNYNYFIEKKSPLDVYLP